MTKVEEFMWYMALGLLLGWGLLALTGCADSTGWRVDFGVSPVKSLHNEAGLAQDTTVKSRRY